MTALSAISVPQAIADALSSASRSTGTDFDYLLKTAVRESGLKPGANAPTSSASGLFQFIEQTWLATVNEAGAKHGLGDFADAISQDAGGRYNVADPQVRQEILALRNDPAISSVMAGELTEMNRADMAGRIGREPSDGELYIGHFLGPGNAAQLIGAAASTPELAAADLFPAAAQSNKSIFYDREGAKRGIGDVYAQLVRQHDSAHAPRAVAVDARELETPFAGITAFFEQLFSGASSQQGAGAQANNSANTGARSGGVVTSYAPAVPQSPDLPAGLQRALALRAPGGSGLQSGGHIFADGLASGRSEGRGEGVSDGREGSAWLLNARAASDAYQANTFFNAAPKLAVEARGNSGAGTGSLVPQNDSGATKPSAEPWAGGLFTNMARQSGPIINLAPGAPL